MPTRIEDIDRYLSAYFASERSAAELGTSSTAMQRPFVTISRQAGVGGHDLADSVLAAFNSHPNADLFGGWQVYDRSICEIVAGDPRFSPHLETLQAEEYRSRASDFFHQMLRSTVDQDLVMKRVFLVVRALAGMGKSIIVGRGGAHVTADMPMGVSIRVIASEADRVSRAMEVLGVDERTAVNGGHKRDADRARLCRSHFGVDIADPTGYDAVFNASALRKVEIADAVAALVASRVSVER